MVRTPFPQTLIREAEQGNAPLRTRRERDTLGTRAVRHDLGRNTVAFGAGQFCVLGAPA